MKNNELSMVDTAYQLLQSFSEAIDFYTLWDRVAQEKQFTEEDKENKMSRFYTSITLDGRMINVGDNHWDLRSRHKFEEVHIDMKDVYTDDDEPSIEDENDDGTIEDNYSDK